MGKSQELGGVVDTNFRVFGVECLRVADQSIYPHIINGHTQTSAYLAGLTLGDKIATEYGLD